MTSGFKIKTDFDIEVTNGLFVFTRDKKEVMQRIKHELLTFKGEDKNDTDRGLDIENIMLASDATKTQRKAEITRCLSYISEITVVDIIEIIEDRVAKYYIKIQIGDTTETITFEVQ